MSIFILVFEQDDELLSISDYDLNKFDLVKYWQGTKMDDCNIDSLVLYANLPNTTDTAIVGGPLSLTILSCKAVRCLEEILAHSVEKRRIQIIDPKKKYDVEYVLINPLHLLNCLNIEHTTYLDEDTILKPALSKNLIPSELNIFSVANYTGSVFVTSKFVEVVKRYQLKGFEFIEVKLV